eukprot:m.76109 g.76109  ORF g.76109 m.76109 type:complete len:141 (-) comp12543_c1_seq5:47-469(-)
MRRTERLLLKILGSTLLNMEASDLGGPPLSCLQCGRVVFLMACVALIQFPYSRPWKPEHIGPPGGPEDAWRVYNNSLYLNFRPRIMDNFFSDAEKNINAADQRWIKWFGKLQAGPFNYKCVSVSTHTDTCENDPQPVPSN